MGKINTMHSASARGTFMMQYDNDGHLITPTPKYPAAIKCNIDVVLDGYDKTCLPRESWMYGKAGHNSDGDTFEARMRIIDSACENFRKKLEQTLDKFCNTINDEYYPVFSFGDMFYDSSNGYCVTIYVYGHNAGYCYASGDMLHVKVTDGTPLFSNGSVFDHCTMSFMDVTVPRNLTEDMVKEWVISKAVVLSGNIASAMLHFKEISIDCEKVVSRSSEFQYIVTTMLLSQLLSKEDNTENQCAVVERVLGSYAIFYGEFADNLDVSQFNSLNVGKTAILVSVNGPKSDIYDTVNTLTKYSYAISGNTSKSSNYVTIERLADDPKIGLTVAMVTFDTIDKGDGSCQVSLRFPNDPIPKFIYVIRGGISEDTLCSYDIAHTIIATISNLIAEKLHRDASILEDQLMRSEKENNYVELKCLNVIDSVKSTKQK